MEKKNYSGCDPGHDDAIAMMMAKRKQIRFIRHHYCSG